MLFHQLKDYLGKRRRPSAAEKLRRSSCTLAARLADALEAAVATPGPEEGMWINRIENLRAELERSDEVLGAWERPWLAQSKELMKRVGASDGGEITIGFATTASKSAQWCRLLYNLARHLRASRVIELGTNVGISGLYLAAAIEDSGMGTLITLEGAEPKAQLARTNFERLGLGRHEVVVGDFFDTLPKVLEAWRPVDLAFIDGFHDGAATVKFHQQFKQVSDDTVLVYDDVRWSTGMERGWKQIKNDPQVAISVDMGAVGICAVCKDSIADPVHIRW